MDAQSGRIWLIIARTRFSPQVVQFNWKVWKWVRCSRRIFSRLIYIRPVPAGHASMLCYPLWVFTIHWFFNPLMAVNHIHSSFQIAWRMWKGLRLQTSGLHSWTRLVRSSIYATRPPFIIIWSHERKLHRTANEWVLGGKSPWIWPKHVAWGGATLPLWDHVPDCTTCWFYIHDKFIQSQRCWQQNSDRQQGFCYFASYVESMKGGPAPSHLKNKLERVNLANVI